LKWLEHKVPPPVVGAVVGLLMWGLSKLGAPLSLGDVPRYAATAVLGAIGLGFDVLGLLAFRAKRTTVNPLRPEKASALVDGGVYRITRNPMYVGMLCLLLAWAVFLASPLALIGPVLFVLYITRFQILPEERILRERFGTPYEDYLQRVRRWI
jgi:protein-S-isoprenylcysteine O-methyltransferase Ste14